MKKKIIFLAAFMVFLLSACGNKTESVTSEKNTQNEEATTEAILEGFDVSIADGEATLYFKGNSNEKKLEVPEEVNGNKVVCFGLTKGQYIYSLESFYIPNSVEKINPTNFERIRLTVDSLFPELYTLETGWCVEYLQAGELAEGEELPDWGMIIPIEQNAYISGFFYSKLPTSIRSTSGTDAGAILLIERSYPKRLDYQGAAFDSTAEVFLINTQTKECIKIYSKTNKPPVTGTSPLYGAEITDVEIWQGIGKLFKK